MDKSNQKNCEKDIQNSNEPQISSTFNPSFEQSYNIIMKLKNNFLRETFLDILGDGEDPNRLKCAFFYGIKYLSKQQKEADEFMEKVNRGEVTVGELFYFYQHRINAIYCVCCLEEIKEENKVTKCIECGNIFHEKCFNENFNFGGKCEACEKNMKL